jgi:hypothetical protein
MDLYIPNQETDRFLADSGLRLSMAKGGCPLLLELAVSKGNLLCTFNSIVAIPLPGRCHRFGAVVPHFL